MARGQYTAPPGTPLWERQTSEGPKAWEAFVVYRDLGQDRSIRLAADRMGKSQSYLERLSFTYGWADRIAAWEMELDRQARKEQVAAIKKMRKRHADLAAAALTKTARALARIPDDDFKAADIARLMDVASRLERISRGDVGEVVEEREGESLPTVTFYMPDNSRGDTQAED